MADLVEDYATPDVRAECEKDTKYEKNHKLEFVICRACGRKFFRPIARHLDEVHTWTLEQYHERYPGAPAQTPSGRRRQMEWLRLHPKVAKARNARSHASRQRKLEQVPTLKQQIIETEKQASEMADRFALPADWTIKSPEEIFIGLILKQQTYMSNDQLAEYLDASHGPRCRWSEDGKWAIITRPGPAANFISKTRKWVGRPGRAVGRA
jgi:hypothetical protein